MVNSRSAGLYAKAQTLFPGGVNSPVRAFRSVGGTPLFMTKGQGSRITDADGNTYIDLCCSWGPLILGHADHDVTQAIIEAVQKGASFGAPTVQENELAELIISNHRYVDRLRFVSSGTEAVMSAIRLARGFTGRSKVLKFEGCYHGHVDSLLVKAGSGLVTFGNSSSAGVPVSFVNETIVVSLDDLAAVESAFVTFKDQIAAVILEPVPANNGLLPQAVDFLKGLRTICDREGALLIFDEVISGFRVGFEGAAGLYGIRPDLLTFGKIIGGGMPVGAYGGHDEVMRHISPEGPVYQAGTLSGNPVAMAAGKAQLSRCLEAGFYDSLELKAKHLVNHVNAHCAAKRHDVHMWNIASIFWIAFSPLRTMSRAEQIDADSMTRFRTFYHALLNRGVYMGPSGYEVGFFSAAHSNADVQAVATAYCEAIDLAMVA
jgi:glutamate-1-semialdehyde 2,1-aminomutase